MGLKMSDNLRKTLTEKESDKPKLIINMGKKNNYGFRPLTDEDLEGNAKEDIDLDNASLETITKYVKEHTSGDRKHYDLMEGGKIFVSFPKFVEMINDGYNIYKSEVISKDFISIEYQKEIKRKMGGR